MIDIESFVFSTIAESLRDQYDDNIFVTGEYHDSPASFPAVSIVEIGNNVYENSISTTIENASSCSFEINVYSNKIGTKKLEAKQILSDIDDLMSELGFVRIMMNPIPNLQDATIYRLVARYTGVVTQENNGTDITYRVYTR